MRLAFFEVRVSKLASQRRLQIFSVGCGFCEFRFSKFVRLMLFELTERSAVAAQRA